MSFLTDRVQRIKPSPTLAVTLRAAELKASGKDIIGLGAGEPDFDTPEHIKEAAIKALREGQTKYTAVDGTAGLKKAIIHKFERDNSLSYTPKQILVSCGAKHSLFNLFLALLQAGDEVIIPAPYWVSYPDMALLADAKPVIISAGLDQQFKITPTQLEAAITQKTKLLVLNSPSNPTGVAYSKAELQALGAVLLKHPQVWVVSDDIYEPIWWAKESFNNILMACPELYDRTIVVNGVSKSYSMTGWRIGYAAGPIELIGAMSKIQSQSTSNPTSISQAAAQAALDGPQDCVTEMVKAFQQRHEFVFNGLAKIPGVQVMRSDGTFYSFPNFQGAMEKLNIADDIAFAELLLTQVGVAIVPGSAFGAPGYGRLSFATDLKTLEEAIARIHRAVIGG